MSSAQNRKLPNTDRLKNATIALVNTKELIIFVHELSKVILSDEILPPLKNDYKFELFSYTIDDAKSSPSAAKKFECADLAKPDSPIKKDKPYVLIYISDKRSKDGKELIGKSFNKTEIERSNLIYNAYTEGKSELAPIEDTLMSFVYFVKCLVHNNIHPFQMKLHDNEFVLKFTEIGRRNINKTLEAIKNLKFD